jgi:hypothetical protein
VSSSQHSSGHAPGHWTLAIDFGATTSVGAIRVGDTARLVEVDGQTAMPSAVFLDPVQGPLVGAVAVERGAARPDAYEPTPRRRLAEEQVTLAGYDLAATELAAAVLERIHDEACRAQGTPPAGVRLTYPAGWTNSPKLGALGLAAVAAGIENVRFAPEAVAAAHLIVEAEQLAVGARLAILDLAGGALDCAVLENTWWGLVLLGNPGGLDPSPTDPVAAAAELAATIASAGLTPDQLTGVHLLRDAAVDPAMAAAVLAALDVEPRPVPDPAAAVALGAARAEDAVFTTIGSLSEATRQAAMARNKAAGSAVIASGATARSATGEPEPEGQLWWTDQGIAITAVVAAAIVMIWLLLYVVGA